MPTIHLSLAIVHVNVKCSKYIIKEKKKKKMMECNMLTDKNHIFSILPVPIRLG